MIAFLDLSQGKKESAKHQRRQTHHGLNDGLQTRPDKSASPNMTRYRLLAPVIVLLCNWSYANAQTPLKSGQSILVDIKLETSRSQPAVGTNLGVGAEIKNLSTDSTVYLQENRVTLSVPPELLGPFAGPAGYWAFFPTQHTEAYDGIITLKPGGTSRVFWSLGPSGPNPQSDKKEEPPFYKNLSYQVLSELNYVFFSPGDYKLSVVAQYWTNPKTPDDYRVTTQTASMNVAAPQSVILFGAAIGGLIAYLLLPQARRRVMEYMTAERYAILYAGKRVATELAGILGAMLLSAIVTILLGRISETQFLIRVTVNDFWGAIAVGFIANYAGAKLLEKILGKTGAAAEK